MHCFLYMTNVVALSCSQHIVLECVRTRQDEQLGSLRASGALEVLNVDVAAGGYHMLKVRGSQDYLLHVDRAVVAFESVFTPLMMYLGNDNKYTGDTLFPRLEVGR